MPDGLTLPFHPRWLLVSCSARKLANSAARAGLTAATIDFFADEDTREAVQESARVPSGVFGFEAESLLAAADRLAPEQSGCGLVYGSGFECDIELLRRLCRGRTLYGNSPDTLALLKTPQRFFDLLKRLGISHPDVRFAPPPDAVGWLVKPVGGTAGIGIRPARRGIAPVFEHYHQRELAGGAYSALFLADGHTACILGYNSLWTADHETDAPYLFAGAINQTDLTAAQKQRVADDLNRLVPTTGLTGLNSLDFMLDGDAPSVLEINPRPSATQVLYEPDYPRGLLALHIAACQGWLPDSVPNPAATRAFRAWFAPAPLVIRSDMAWPDGCVDRPGTGTRFATGAAVCTVEAEGPDVQTVLDSLDQRFERLSRQCGQSPEPHWQSCRIRR